MTINVHKTSNQISRSLSNNKSIVKSGENLFSVLVICQLHNSLDSSGHKSQGNNSSTLVISVVSIYQAFSK